MMYRRPRTVPEHLVDMLIRAFNRYALRRARRQTRRILKSRKG